LTCGALPDALMESVGGCRGLLELKLNATASIHMGPVAHLTQLTRVTLTVSGAWQLCALASTYVFCSGAVSICLHLHGGVTGVREPA
jgi:hypothetical protein